MEEGTRSKKRLRLDTRRFIIRNRRLILLKIQCRRLSRMIILHD